MLKLFMLCFQILSVDTGHSVRSVCWRRSLKVCLELLLCSLCPLPGQAALELPLLGRQARAGRRALVPLHVLLTLPMFGRLYLCGRALVLHSMIIKVGRVVG